MKKSLIIVALLVLTGCATTGQVTPQYISPTTYQNHSCEALQGEVTRINHLIGATKNQNIPLSASGVGIGITGGRHGIYPSISFGVGAGSGQRQAKINTLAKLYGEHDAMIITARQKSCAFAKGVKIYGE